jgi:hypothetical protein
LPSQRFAIAFGLTRVVLQPFIGFRAKAEALFGKMAATIGSGGWRSMR